MLHLIPAPWHRAALGLMHQLRLGWWRLRKPLLVGCRVLAFDAAGRVLLIRHSYGSGRWMLPGGGVGRREDPVTAGCRELREEVGCGLSAARQFMVTDEPLSGTTNRVHLICGTAIGSPKPDGREVIEATFHDPAHLPSNLAVTLAQGLTDWITAAKAAHLRPLEAAADDPHLQAVTTIDPSA